MFEEFIRKIRSSERVAVISHIRPDGDCIGSQIALCRWLKKNGKQVAAFNDDDVPVNLKWMTRFFSVQKPTESSFGDFDLYICVDGNALPRFGYFGDWARGKDLPIWMVDHHPDPKPHFDLMASDDTASSTCELIYNLYAENDISQLDTETAKCLYTGIITDTGSLQFRSVTPETVETVARLLRIGGFTPDEVVELVFSNKSVEQYKLLSEALTSIKLYGNNQIAVMYVTHEMLEKADAGPDDCEGFVNYPLSLSGVKAALLFKDFYDEGVRISLRSRSNIDVNIWARELDGGGHTKAAGAWHPGPLEKAIEDVVRIGSKQL